MGLGVCDPCIEVAIAIEVTEGNAVAIGVAECLAAVCEVASYSSLVAPLVDPHAVGLAVVVGDPGIEIAIAIEVAEGDIAAIGVAECLTAVCEVAQSIVDPHAVGLAAVVCDPCIEIAIAIEVTEGDTEAIGVAECLRAVCEVAQSIVDPHAVGLVVEVCPAGGVEVCDPCIEIAIAIEVPEGDTEALGSSECLTADCEVAESVIDPHAVGLAVVVRDPRIEIAIAIEVTEGDTEATGVAECLRAVFEVAQSIVDPHAVGLVFVCDPCIKIAIAIEVAEGNIGAIGVAECLRTVGEATGLRCGPLVEEKAQEQGQ